MFFHDLKNPHLLSTMNLIEQDKDVSNISGIVPATPILLDVYWKDMYAESEWVSRS